MTTTRTTPRSGRRRLLDAAARLTTPLLPDDYLAMVNPLWSTRELRARIEAIRPETADSVTLVLKPGTGYTRHEPGQYIGVGVEIDGVRHWRTYSLTSVPSRADGCLEITVKAMPDGLVSNHLVRHTAVGTILRIAPPAGEFLLPVPSPPRLLFITGGSGITPVMGMLRTLVKRAPLPDVVLIHSAPTADDVIFAAELQALAADQPTLRLNVLHTDSDGMLDAGRLAELCPDWHERPTWACGPAGLLDSLAGHFGDAGVSDALCVERFAGPVRADPDARGGTVTFVNSSVTVEADGNTSLLNAGEEAGALLASGCRMGICQTCVGRLRCGQVRDLRTGEIYGDEGEIVRICVSAAAGPVEIEL